MSTSSKIIIVIGWVFALAALGKIIHYEGWKQGYKEGACDAQPKLTDCRSVL